MVNYDELNEYIENINFDDIEKDIEKCVEKCVKNKYNKFLNILYTNTNNPIFKLSSKKIIKYQKKSKNKIN